MSTHKFKQVDVFTDRALSGNPVAVIFDADGMTGAEMQAVAAWTNLSETTFLCRPTTPEADYRLRIFHPTGELPFAGHPTIGSAHAAIEAGVVTKLEFVMGCGAGLLPLHVEGEGAERRIFVRAPQAEVIHEYGTSLKAISDALGAPVEADPPPTTVRNGPVWLFCRMASADIAALKPDMSAVARLSRDFGGTGFSVFALTPEGSPVAAGHRDLPPGRGGAEERTSVHIRCFAPAAGVPEDPVTGSANAALPTHLARHGLLEITGREYISSQGREIGRDGRVHVRVLDESGLAEIGGQSVTVIEGEIRL
jgi:PhzF family phenazine biosynthesis protein